MDLVSLKAAATSIRLLAADAVEASTTGHPGMPMGMAELGATLYGEILRHDPTAPGWPNRDRFVLSAGHGSLLLYSCLHLAGYALPLDEIKRFRRAGSITPGHPERELTPGVEVTTGPLGSGFGAAVGIALAERVLAGHFNREGVPIFDHHTYVLSGDGCMMEGVTSEAASLAGHLRLGRLIVFYDSNRVSIEGPTDITFTENVAARFRAYGWNTLAGDGHDPEAIARLGAEARAEGTRPTLIVLSSRIGRGAPTMEGKHEVHGTPLGKEEIRAMRRSLGAPEDQDFWVDPRAYTWMAERARAGKALRLEWESLLAAWSARYPELRRELDEWLDPTSGARRGAAARLPVWKPGDKASTRDVGGKLLQAYADAIPSLLGGSADLGPTVRTEIKGYGDLQAPDYAGRTIRFGVREHAMGSVCNGLALHGGIRPYCATLVVFADYMRPAMRRAAIQGLPVIYILTHDSVFLGADGPTHQPVEHLASLRVMPNMRVLRPADAQEAAVAWQMALERTDGPTVIALSRQPIPVFAKADRKWETTVRRGAYVAREVRSADVVVVASGSEVAMAMDTAEGLTDVAVRVVSVLSLELLLAQPASFLARLLPPGVPVVALEAGVRSGWEALTSRRDHVLGIDRYGISGRADEVAQPLGFTPRALVSLIRKAHAGRPGKPGAGSSGSRQRARQPAAGRRR